MVVRGTRHGRWHTRAPLPVREGAAARELLAPSRHPSLPGWLHSHLMRSRPSHTRITTTEAAPRRALGRRKQHVADLRYDSASLQLLHGQYTGRLAGSAKRSHPRTVAAVEMHYTACRAQGRGGSNQIASRAVVRQVCAAAAPSPCLHLCPLAVYSGHKAISCRA